MDDIFQLMVKSENPAVNRINQFLQSINKDNHNDSEYGKNLPFDKRHGFYYLTKIYHDDIEDYLLIIGERVKRFVNKQMKREDRQKYFTLYLEYFSNLARNYLS